jgi:hypothetical protein
MDHDCGLRHGSGLRVAVIWHASCSSSYFAPALLAARHGRRLTEQFSLVLTRPWQAQIDRPRSTPSSTAGRGPRWCSRTSGNAGTARGSGAHARREQDPATREQRWTEALKALGVMADRLG